MPKRGIASDTTSHRREGHVVAVERRAPFVVDDAPRIKMRLTRVLTFLQSGDSAFDSLDSVSNPLLDEVRGQLRFGAKSFVEDFIGFLFRGDAIVVRVSPRPLCGRVCTEEELVFLV